ncbi:MAG TPA: hypothetical protein VHM72_04860, partial [Solirubrobacteraceae bacterium]|nr:hypothetical protein [Solirubrobacteraceae bacterium]
PPDPGVGLVATADPLVDHRLQHDLRALAALVTNPGADDVDRAVERIGINVAVPLAELPDELRETAGTLGLDVGAVEPLLERLLDALDGWLGRPQRDVLNAWRRRDALIDAAVHWADGDGVARGIDEEGRLLVETGDATLALSAGEVHIS